MTRKIISLNDSMWRVGSVEQKPFGDVNDLGDVSEWLPAQVPGDVRLDLIRAGKISDPFFGANNEDSQWVDARDWWYARSLESELELEKDERAFLIFDGIDYQSAVFWRGEQLGRHVGMFSSQVCEIQSANSRAVRNSQLAIRVWGSDALPRLQKTIAQKLWARVIAPLFRPPDVPFPDRYATLKCQMQFGWDFAPRLRTCGIWDDARVVLVRSVFIHNAWIKPKVKNQKQKVARVSVVLHLDSDREQDARIIATARGKNFSGDVTTCEFDVRLSRGDQVREITFDLENAQLWQPWDRGDPNLYEIEIIITKEESPLPHPPLAKGREGVGFDSLTSSFGIRDFELTRSPGSSEPWQFVVNGQREFLRGANWVPLDAIPGRLTRDDYTARLKQARDANINFLRVWGGGLREKRAFYDLCDEMGILVWQEFPFAGAILDRFPRDRAFLQLVRDEASGIVRVLRHHPSLVVWCGGNEFNTRGNAAVVKKLRGVVKDKDGTRPFKPASPYRDESHNWSVWHRVANLRDYRHDRTPFLSEFGLQAMPNLESLQKFLPEGALSAPHPLWEYHRGDLKKLGRYAASVIHPPLGKGRAGVGSTNSLDEFVEATQHAQAFALQIAIEHIRRRKPQTTGVAIWQFNDPWTAISWSVVDYYGAPKRAYYELQKLYSPVLASFDYPLVPRRAGDVVRGELWLINDLRSSFENAQLTAYLNDQEIFSRRVNIAPDSAERVDSLQVKLGEGENVLRLKVNWGPPTLSDHSYDLNFCDVGEIDPLGALLFAVGKRLMK
ncbi:MAG: hypothetical protein HY868_11965 [Chloroflexi bacterium]|nr:hypothetical protein [Chloroflexota bacterium]